MERRELGLEKGKLKENLTEVIRVGALFIVSCFPYVLVSGLLPRCDVIPHGEEAWQVISHILNIKLWKILEKSKERERTLLVSPWGQIPSNGH